MPSFTHQNHRLFYREQGSGPLLLVLPGNTASSACHQGELDYFSDRFHVVSMDFWGTGQSDRMEHWPEDWYLQAARDAAALVIHLGETNAIFMGTSGGAAVALLAGIHCPGQVQAVIADSICERFLPEMVDFLLVDRGTRNQGQVQFWSFAHGADWPAVVDADTEMVAHFGRSGGDYFRGRLAEIRCPVLITGSLKDNLIPQLGPDNISMAAQIADCQLYLVNQGGHPLMWSNAQSFRRTADLFLAKYAA